MGGCGLCRLQQYSAGEHPVLYAGNPLLRTLLTELLRCQKIAFHQEDGVYVFPGISTREALAALLDKHLTGAEKDDLRIATSSLAGLASAERFSDFRRKADTAWFDRALREDRFTFHFQPIVDVTAMSIYAHECLVRLFADREYLGAEIVDAAISRGRIHAFDDYCRQKAIREAAENVDPGSKLFINFLPSSIYNPEYCLQATLTAVRGTKFSPESIVFEVVESDRVRNIPSLKTIRDFYRANGFNFALDDVGSGANSLQTIADFQPDYIKLDQSLTSGLENPIRLAAVRKIFELADEFGIKVIAEGVETAAQAAALAGTGIRLMQGWFFGHSAAAGVTAASLANLARQMNTCAQLTGSESTVPSELQSH
ncbi:MAG: EAL domain-containing protein [Bryobacterales bacterium]|nr:EAL domain-containing protein [Bryobacterales bacterium]